MDVDMILRALDKTVSEVGVHESVADLINKDAALDQYS